MRGAVVTETRTGLRQNLFTNPSIEVNTTGYYAAIPAGGAASVTRMTDGGYSGSSYARFTCTTAPGSVGGGFYVGTASFGHIAVTAGVTYTASAFVRSAASRTYLPRFDWYSSLSGGTVLSSNNGAAITVEDTSRWAQLSVSATAPAGAIACMVTFYANTAPAFTVSDYYDIDAVVLEVKYASGQYYPYFDGDSPNAKWEGTAHASTSLELTDVRSKNLIADSAFQYTYKPTITGASLYNLSGYWNCPWRTVIDGTMGSCIECVTDTTANPQGLLAFPQVANSPGYANRPKTQVGEQYTVSMYMLAATGLDIVFGFRKVNSAHTTTLDGPTSQHAIGTGSWQRYTYTITITATEADYYLGFQARVYTVPIPAVGTTFRIAKIQVEKSGAATSFVATRPDW